MTFWRPTFMNYYLHDYAKPWEKESDTGDIDLQIVVRGPGNQKGVLLNWDKLRDGITADGGFNRTFLQNTLSDLRGAKKLVLGVYRFPIAQWCVLTRFSPVPYFKFTRSKCFQKMFFNTLNNSEP